LPNPTIITIITKIAMLFPGKTIALQPAKFLANTLLVAGLLLIGWQWLFPSGSLKLLTPLGIGLFSIGSIGQIYLNFFQADSANLQHYTWFKPVANRGFPAWLLGIILTAFYVVLYWFPEYLGNLIRGLDPLSEFISNRPADRWFLYGFFYSLAVLIMGIRALIKYRHSRYHSIRTISVIFFQLVFAFLIPQILILFNKPEFYFSYFWPLKYDYLFPDTLQKQRTQPGGLPVFMIFWSLSLTFLATPVLTYFYGKRWYCSWICGCGGLAETAGDPFRHLSDKSRKAWKIEVAIIYPVLFFVIVTTGLLWLNSYWQGAILGNISGIFARTYGFLIGLVFAGVIGVGFYPLLGSRVWCRFGCPMAAYLGLLQKHFSRFRISTNGGQCISCGNCSTYCEMGIDVKWYAQQGKPIIRASCVGCGMCATVCPRGVLKLENKNPEGRYQPNTFFHAENLRILD
jgi:ferredoxin-type protein NapH